jgi:hypothetical protein
VAKHKQKVPEEIRKFWRLLDMPSVDAAWHELNRRSDAAASTIEALMFSLRRGPEALTHAGTLNRLAQLSEPQLLEVMTRVQKFKPEIAPAWTPEQVRALAILRSRL